ncbi:MAG: hypothetical protein ACTSSJ_07245 [Candidatus Odinarchaeia archaeon]
MAIDAIKVLTKNIARTLIEIKAIILQNQLYLLNLSSWFSATECGREVFNRLFTNAKKELDKTIKLLENFDAPTMEAENCDRKERETDVLRYFV